MLTLLITILLALAFLIGGIYLIAVGYNWALIGAGVLGTIIKSIFIRR